MALRFESTQQDVQSVQLPALHDQALLVCDEEERDIEDKNETFGAQRRRDAFGRWGGY